VIGAPDFDVARLHAALDATPGARADLAAAGARDQLAKQADKAGADAIIKFHEWRAPSKWSWAATKAGGMAVKWTAERKAGVSALKGQCWSVKGQDANSSSTRWLTTEWSRRAVLDDHDKRVAQQQTIALCSQTGSRLSQFLQTPSEPRHSSCNCSQKDS
jgi:hypothetical protein